MIETFSIVDVNGSDGEYVVDDKTVVYSNTSILVDNLTCIQFYTCRYWVTIN